MNHIFCELQLHEKGIASLMLKYTFENIFLQIAKVHFLYEKSGLMNFRVICFLLTIETMHVVLQ